MVTETAELLTVKEVADLMRMNDRTILRLAQRGEIPAAKIAHRWRFDRELVNAWLHSRMSIAGEAGWGPGTEADSAPRLSELIKPEYVSLSLASAGRDGVLEEMVGLAVAAGLLFERERFLASLIARENLLTTALFDGVAIPHPRSALPDLFKDTAIVLGRSGNGVKFGAPDARLTYVFFMVCAPSDTVHLKVLAGLARLLKGTQLVRTLRAVSSVEDMIGAVVEAEERRDSVES